METILVVEDDPQSAMLLRDFCEQEGHPVITATTGAEARAALGEHVIALVLLDLRLPDVDGVKLMREIRQGERPPDVIITTAHAGRESAIAAIRRGMKTMFQDGIAKTVLGETTLEEVFRVAL